MLSVDEGGLRVQDLGSTNGTYVNGSWAEAYSLSAGDEVIIGKLPPTQLNDPNSEEDGCSACG